MKSFMINKEIMEEYNIKISTLQRHKKRIFALYDIDIERLPKQGMLPTKVVRDHFDIDCVKKKNYLSKKEPQI
jgi:hypothetical protein